MDPKEQVKTLTAENENLAAKLSEIVEASNKLSADYEHMKQVNEKLAGELAALSTGSPADVKVKPVPVIPAGSFKVDGKKYRFTMPTFTLDGEIITASDALADKDIQAKLVALGAGCIAEI